MKLVFFMMIFFLVMPDQAFCRRRIQQNISPQRYNAWHLNYLCTEGERRYPGYGRPSREGAYSSQLDKHVKAGEYVLFQFQPGGVRFWYPSDECRKI